MSQFRLIMLLRLCLLLLLGSTISLVSAGCWQRRMCCAGRNTTCKASDDGISHLPANRISQTHYQSLRERYYTSTSTTEEPRPMEYKVPHYEGSGQDYRLVYPEVYDSEHGEKIGRLVMPDIVELEGSGSGMIYNKYEGSGDTGPQTDEDVLTEEDSTLTSTTPASNFEYLIFGKERSEPETRDTIKYTDKPRHLLVRRDQGTQPTAYSVLQRHLPVTVATVPLDSQQIMYLEAPEIECYCDEECVKLGDCCSDYTYVCPPQDCLVDHWAHWEPCVPDQGACGIGVQQRLRRVRAEAVRGGAECPPLKEMKTCWVQCPSAPDDITTVALLIDYKFNKTRSKKKRNNVYWDLPENAKKLKNAPHYCVEYRLGWVNRNCIDKDVTSHLFKNSTICAECQPEATLHRKTQRCASDLEDGQTGFWKLIGLNSKQRSCNGIWYRIKRTDNCSCSENYPDLPPYLIV